MDVAQSREHREPTRLSATVFRGKASLLQLHRAALDIRAGIRRYPQGDGASYPTVLAESRTPLWMEESLAERALQLGKVQNLRCALRRLNGAQVPAGQTFSFWKQIGQATPRRGYVAGRLLREGCLMPAVGGGLCQLSNALYDVALQADFEIVERWAHSRVIPGSAAAAGRDATVAWNYIDLRFRPHQLVLIEAYLTRDEMILRVRGQAGRMGVNGSVPSAPRSTLFSPPTPLSSQTSIPLDTHAHSCATCGATSCFRHNASRHGSKPSCGRTAYLLDECWPEFARYVAAQRTCGDILGIPLDGVRWRQRRYGWDTSGYARVGTATWQTLARSVATRRLGQYGAARLQAQLDGAATLATRLARELAADVTHVCIAQSLLPFLWRHGHLGGRSFEVLMTRLPLRTLQERLDAGLKAHPERHTLGEFRAPDWLVEAEEEALSEAGHVITPHTAIAALFPARSLLLDWDIPPRRPSGPPVPRGKTIAFPGPTAARKGAYELRCVARELDLEIVLLGSDLEGDNFWQGVRTRHMEGDWLHEIAAVVQPALVEEKPRPLLAALAAGIPVIATPACGLGQHSAVMTIPEGNEAALQAALESILLAAREEQ